MPKPPKMKGSKKLNYYTRAALAANLRPVGDPQPAKVIDGLRDMPVNKVVAQCQYLENVLLPRIKKKSGDTSADYKQFYEIFRSLLYALLVFDRHDFLQRQYFNLRLKAEFYEQRAALAERELAKYQAAESFLVSECMDHVLAGAASRAADLLNQKSK